MNRLILTMALMGWALFGYSILPSRSSGPDASAEVARLRQALETISASRDKLAGTLQQLNQKKEDLKYLQKRIAAATQELKRLEYMRARVSGEIDAGRTPPSAPADQASASGRNAQPDAKAAQSSQPTPPVAPTPPTSAAHVTAASSLSKEQVRAAQEALTALGYGPLKADGVLGPGTRGAIEAFERSRGLPVTGGLGASTLQALRVTVP